MTQALLNNVNKLTESICSQKELKADTETLKSINFEKILDKQQQTVENNKQVKAVDVIQPASQKTIKNTETTNNVESETTFTKNVQDEQIKSDCTTVIENAVDSTDGKKEELTTIIETVVQEAEAEAAIDINTAVDINAAVENFVNIALTAENKNNETISDDTQADNAETEENTTITGEDTTMNKEQITLENQSTLLYGQAQIITNNRKTDDSEDVEINTNQENNLISFKQTSSDNISSEQTKQVLSQNTVKFTELATKDSSAQKTDNTKSIKNIISEDRIKELNIEQIDSGSAENESSSDNLMQNQTPQEQAAKAMIRGDSQFESIKSIQQIDMLKTALKPAEVTPSRIVEQITKQLEGMYSNSRVNIILNPENLGKVALNIISTKDGLSAQFTVTTQEARDLLMKGLNGLKEGLLAQGVSVDNVTVKLSETGDSKHQSDWTEQEGSHGGYKGQGFRQKKDDNRNFEQMMFELNEDGNV